MKIKMKDLRPGMKIYRAGWGFLGKEFKNPIVVEEKYVIECGPHEGYTEGDSMKRSSSTYSSPWRPEEEMTVCLSPEEAVWDFLEWQDKLLKWDIEKKKEELAGLKKRKALYRKKLSQKGVPKFEVHPAQDEDWEPCCY